MEKTLISSISFGLLKSISTQSGPAFCVPSFQPPPAPQFRPLRSPLLIAETGYPGPSVDEADARPPLAGSATSILPGRGLTVTWIAADVVAAPLLSVATAVSA